MGNSDHLQPLAPRWYSRGHRYWWLGHVLTHRWKTLGVVFTTLIGIVLQTLIPFQFRTVFDEALPNGDRDLLLELSLFIILLGVAGMVFTFMAGAMNEIMAQNVERRVRVELFDNLQSKSMTFHDSARVGDLMSMSSADTRMINGSVSPGVRMISSAFIGMLAAGTAMYLTSPALSLVFLAILPFYLVFMFRYGKVLLPLSSLRQKRVAEVNAILQENLSGVRVVRTFSAQDREKAMFKERITQLEEILIKRGAKSAFFVPTLIIAVVMASMLIAGIYAMEATVDGAARVSILGLFSLTIEPVSLGDVIAFLLLVGQLTWPTWMLRWLIDMTMMGFAGAERIFDLLKTQASLREGENIQVDGFKGEVQFNDVTFSYSGNGQTVLNKVNLHIGAGETLAVIGPTGCGKTTLGKLLLRLYDPQDGTITIDGMNVSRMDLASLRSHIGVIEQDTFLFSTTIRANIAYGADGATDEQVDAAAEAAQAKEFIEEFPDGYKTRVGDRGVTLSGGQKQRVAMARAFITDPNILIMDDSTSAVDAETEAKIQKALHTLLKDRTTIIVTHRLSTLKTADKIAFMRKGKIERVGTHDELVRTHPPYRQIFAAYQDLPPLEASASMEVKS